MRTGLGQNSDHLWMHYIHKQLQCMSVVMYSSCHLLEPGPSDF